MAQMHDNTHTEGIFPYMALWGKLLAVLTVLMILYAVFLSFSKAGAQGELAILEEEEAQLNLSLETLKRDHVRNLSRAMEAVERLEASQIKWSQALTLVLDATPDDIVYRSFSGNENASITMAAVAGSFQRVADLIDILEQKSFVRKVFVPSVVKGTSPTNAAIYSFSLNMEYEK